MKTCIVIGNGPSLNNVPASFLYKHDTFGSNRIYLKFTPTYYACVNPLVIEQNREEINQLKSMKFVRKGMKIKNAVELSSTAVPLFSYNPMKQIYEGHNVTYVLLQLAYFMDYEIVLLVGVDHRYKFQGKPNEAVRMNEDDPNHFDVNYFKGQLWNNPDLEKSEDAYMLARMAYEQADRKIVNLTENSSLEIFEKDRLERWL